MADKLQYVAYTLQHYISSSSEEEKQSHYDSLTRIDDKLVLVVLIY